METAMTLDAEKPKAKRGFAAIDPKRRREIAARGLHRRIILAEP
jgi:hypothetical protein